MEKINHSVFPILFTIMSEDDSQLKHPGRSPGLPSNRYEGLKQWGWYLDDLKGWKELLGRDEPVKVLEIGAFDGVSANLMLDLLFPHPESEIHCVDPYLPDPTTPQVSSTTRDVFLRNIETGGHEGRIFLYEGLSAEVLAWMIAGEGFWESFDFIYVDGSHVPAAALTDAVMGWYLLKPGGILGFDDYELKSEQQKWRRPNVGIDAFAAAFHPGLDWLKGGGRQFWRKQAEGSPPGRELTEGGVTAQALGFKPIPEPLRVTDPVIMDRLRKAFPEKAGPDIKSEEVAPETKGASARPAATKNRFLILCQKPGPATARLQALLDPFGRVEIVPDRPVDGLAWYDNEALAGYDGLMGQTDVFPALTAWSRAFYHLSLTPGEEDYIWFVEEDVAGDAASWKALVEMTSASGADLAAWEIRSQTEDPGWYFWYKVEPWFPARWKAFQPLCRVSARLIQAALDFRAQHGHFVFHEGLLASLAAREDMKLLDWSRHPVACRCFGTFRWRPVLSNPEPGICHPVKDEECHDAISTWPAGNPDETSQPNCKRNLPRLSQSALSGWSILEDDYLFLVQFCRDYGLRRIVEFGPGDSTAAFLDAGCQVTSFECNQAWLEKAASRFAQESGVDLRFCAEEELPNAAALLQTPDLILIDGPPLRAGQAFSRRPVCEWALQFNVPVLLHDAKRQAEQATLEILKRYGCEVQHVPTQKGLALILPPGFR